LQQGKQVERRDPVLTPLLCYLKDKVTPRSPDWQSPPLQRYKQLWPQLKLRDGIVCR